MDSGEKAKDAITDQAAAWLVRLDSGTADTEQFERWRNADFRHASVFAQVAATWKRTGDLRGLSPAPAIPADEAPEPVRTTRRAMLGSLVGAGALAAAGTAALLWDRRAYAETAVGERRTVQLPDGSRAELNTATRIAWRFGDRREFWLERGEAAIVVAADRARPFVLRADAMRAALEAGRYNGRILTAGPRLVTLAGRALVDTGNGARRALSAGHALALTGTRFRETTLAQGEADALTAWQRGEILFDGMPLSDAVAEFNRYLPRPIAIEDRSIATIRLGGRFFTDDPQGFLTALHDGFGISSRVRDGKVTLYRAPETAPVAAQ
ncbi:MAG: FecR family protein [Pseudomonadota bacterium]